MWGKQTRIIQGQPGFHQVASVRSYRITALKPKGVGYFIPLPIVQKIEIWHVAMAGNTSSSNINPCVRVVAIYEYVGNILPPYIFCFGVNCMSNMVT